MNHQEWIHDAVDRHAGPLLRYAALLAGDADRARDVVQDTFVRLCAAERTKVEGHLAEWLFTVCRHRALDIARKEQRMQPLEEGESDRVPSREPRPDLQVEQRDAAGRILRLITGLPARQQEVVRLKFQAGLSYAEISRVTTLSVSNVGFLIHTAIKSLRQQMNQEPAPAAAVFRRKS